MDTKFKALAVLQARDCFVIQAGKQSESVSHSAMSNSLQPHGSLPGSSVHGISQAGIR